MRGRPVGSEIRKNIIELLFHMNKACGYDIHKVYCLIFPKCTRETIYYHLRKGALINEFELEEVKQEKGVFSWGPSAEKKYYKLGYKAEPKGDERVKNYFDSIQAFRSVS